MKSIQVFAHGKLEKNKLFFEIIEVVKLSFPVVHVHFSKYKNHMKELLNSFEGEYLMIAGGDGTFHEVINELMNADKSPQVYLLPLGSGNDFSRTIGIKSEMYLKNKNLLNWEVKKTDVLRAEFLNNSQHKFKYSLNISDVGIGGEVAQWLYKIPDFLGVTVKYNLAVLLGFLKYNKKRFVISCDEKKLESKLLSLCLGNGRFFANGMCICPHAIYNDGKISISAFKNLSLLDYLKYLPKIKKGIKIEHAEVEYWLTEKIEISSEAPSPIDMDGELGGYTPVTFEVIKHAINLRIPV